MKCKVTLGTLPALALLAMALLGLDNCRRQQEPAPFYSYTPSAVVDLPEPIREAHYSDVFLITWFEPPFPGYYDRLHLYANGTVSRMRIVVDWAIHGGDWGQLTEEEKGEVRLILEAMTKVSPIELSTGSRIITLGFLWAGDNHVLSFSESNCPDELHRLFEIADKALKRNPEWLGTYPDPCQKDNKYDGQVQEPILPEDMSFSLDLPEPVSRVHQAPRLFCTTWFEPPFQGSYEELSFFASNSTVYWQLWGEGGREAARGRLTEEERQEVQDTLDLMTSMDPVEPPVGTTIITFSFPWKADSHLFTFGNANCPADLQHLFEIAQTTFKRDMPELDFQTPCQGEVE